MNNSAIRFALSMILMMIALQVDRWLGFDLSQNGYFAEIIHRLMYVSIGVAFVIAALWGRRRQI